jgi:proteasome accessory factor C
MYKKKTTDNLLVLLALIPYVLDRGQVTIAEAANHFSLDKAHIRKAVELIACAGIPGDNLAYSHLDLFDIDWDLLEQEEMIGFTNTVGVESKLRFTGREVSALMAGLQYLTAHPAYSSRGDLNSVMDKLRAGAGNDGHKNILAISPPVTKHVTLITEAISNGESIVTRYHNKRGEADLRTLDPILLETRDSVWYLRAWCHSREALRTFRLDRMETVAETGNQQKNYSSLIEDVSSNLFEPSESHINVEVSCHKTALPLIAEYLDRDFAIPEDSEEIKIVLQFPHMPGLVKFAVQFSDVLQVISPIAAIEAVRAFSDDALKAYDQPRKVSRWYTSSGQ